MLKRVACSFRRRVSFRLWWYSSLMVLRRMAPASPHPGRATLGGGADFAVGVPESPMPASRLAHAAPSSPRFVVGIRQAMGPRRNQANACRAGKKLACRRAVTSVHCSPFVDGRRVASCSNRRSRWGGSFMWWSRCSARARSAHNHALGRLLELECPSVAVVSAPGPAASTSSALAHARTTAGYGFPSPSAVARVPDGQYHRRRRRLQLQTRCLASPCQLQLAIWFHTVTDLASLVAWLHCNKLKLWWSSFWLDAHGLGTFVGGAYTTLLKSSLRLHYIAEIKFRLLFLKLLWGERSRGRRG